MGAFRDSQTISSFSAFVAATTFDDDDVAAVDGDGGGIIEVADFSVRTRSGNLLASATELNLSLFLFSQVTNDKSLCSSFRVSFSVSSSLVENFVKTTFRCCSFFFIAEHSSCVVSATCVDDDPDEAVKGKCNFLRADRIFPDGGVENCFPFLKVQLDLISAGIPFVTATLLFDGENEDD